ncbi:hypothetical protein P7D52_07940 [Enterococcus dongliensis]|uniref:Phage protein n=1 Tax=Enterococcus dongliensis TaxID=2559925 RepID=A0AAW8TPK3_9ENTE|nr:hypothetical protein [Enterococcus dongliensis]MDT2635495.1 hypothetical protein [Enterococcus dongliensis]MDT2637666.1 hypothetical protein [Enterococcus dongliensis]MDT2642715.1 hypothetical protein [Enterococcus dongliensis]
MKYRKKPVEIEAVLLENDIHSISQALNFVSGMPFDTEISLLDEQAANAAQMTNGLVIPTLEGDVTASFGDYIIKGVQGEFYPCKPDIFSQTYEKVEDGE